MQDQLQYCRLQQRRRRLVRQDATEDEEAVSDVPERPSWTNNSKLRPLTSMTRIFSCE